MEGLTRHQRKLHSGQKNFRCAVCGAGFAYNYDLSRHLRRTHQGHQASAGEEASRVEEGEVVYLCNPPPVSEKTNSSAALVQTDPFPLKSVPGGDTGVDIVQLALTSSSPVLAAASHSGRDTAFLATESNDHSLESCPATLANYQAYSQYQTVEIKGLSYNSILGQ